MNTTLILIVAALIFLSLIGVGIWLLFVRKKSNEGAPLTPVQSVSSPTYVPSPISVPSDTSIPVGFSAPFSAPTTTGPAPFSAPTTTGPAPFSAPTTSLFNSIKGKVYSVGDISISLNNSAQTLTVMNSTTETESGDIPYTIVSIDRITFNFSGSVTAVFSADFTTVTVTGGSMSGTFTS